MNKAQLNFNCREELTRDGNLLYKRALENVCMHQNDDLRRVIDYEYNRISPKVSPDDFISVVREKSYREFARKIVEVKLNWLRGEMT